MSTTKKVSKDLINLRLDKATSVLFEEFSRTKLKEWILSGNILLNGEIASPREKVSLDDEIEVNPINEVSTEWCPENIDFSVLYETNDFLYTHLYTSFSSDANYFFFRISQFNSHC